MQLTVYILFQVVAIAALIFTFYTDVPLVSALTMLSSGILIVGSWILHLGNTFLWDASIRAYVSEPIIIQTPYIPYINMAIFGLALMYFFYDVFTIAQNDSPKLNNIAPGRGSQ
jgi:hypothetical protein